MTIPYNLNIPAGPNNPSQDQPKMQENTNSINQIIDVDHFTFVSSGSRDGWHKQSTYPISTIAPPTLAFQGAVYTKDIGGGVVPLFYRRELNGPEIQITGASSTLALEGQTFLPGGLLLQWGQKSGVNSGSTINWATPFTAFFSATLTRQETVADNRGFIQFASGAVPTNTGFTVRIRDSSGSQLNNQTIFWIAIGTA